jgi:hypothetical protein
MDKLASLGINGDIIDGKDFKSRENLNVTHKTTFTFLKRLF